MHQDLRRDFSLDGRVAVITGGGSGIGQASAAVLAEAGAKLVLCDLNETGLAETAAMVEERGSHAVIRRVDVSSRDAVEALAETALREQGRVDVWVNCAATVTWNSILEVTEAEIDRQIAVNVKGVYWGCAAAARAMAQSGGGSIVNFSSSGADFPSPGISVYSMTKAAVNALTRACAVEFGPQGIRVNAIGPGYTYTPMTRAAKEPDPARREEMIRSMSKNVPLGYTAVPRDQALAVLYLASDASRFVTGQVLRPNGGTFML